MAGNRLAVLPGMRDDAAGLNARVMENQTETHGVAKISFYLQKRIYSLKTESRILFPFRRNSLSRSRSKDRKRIRLAVESPTSRDDIQYIRTGIGSAKNGKAALDRGCVHKGQ